jgi:hypothetical protein
LACYVRFPVLWHARRADARSGRSLCPQARQGRIRGQRLELPRHGGITVGADTIAALEWHRGLHPVPDDMLLAPGTDDLEQGHVRTRTHVLPSLMSRISLVSHHCSPSSLAAPARPHHDPVPAQPVIRIRRLIRPSARVTLASQQGQIPCLGVGAVTLYPHCLGSWPTVPSLDSGRLCVPNNIRVLHTAYLVLSRI